MADWLHHSVSSPPVSWCVCVCVGGGCSGAIWLSSHHPGGCCTLVVVEEMPPSVKRFECLKALYKCKELILFIIPKLKVNKCSIVRLFISVYWRGK